MMDFIGPTAMMGGGKELMVAKVTTHSTNIGGSAGYARSGSAAASYLGSSGGSCVGNPADGVQIDAMFFYSTTLVLYITGANSELFGAGSKILLNGIEHALTNDDESPYFKQLEFGPGITLNYGTEYIISLVV